MSLTRQGVSTGPCEDVANLNNVPVYPVQVGSRLKVGWTSGNRGGNLICRLLTFYVLKFTRWFC